MFKKLAIFLFLMSLPGIAFSLEIYKKGDISLNAGWWGQMWFQSVSNMDTNGDGRFDDTLNDFLIRRSYFYLGGNVNEQLSFFTHLASDKLGMDEITNDSNNGLGSGIAVRDAWISYQLLGNDLIVQAGRMYVPFTRDYGTTSTKSLLITDLDWGQGGYRSTIFYPSRIGREDGVTLWGNVFADKLQYRFMVGDGEEDNAKNRDDKLRYAGRLSYNFFDPETDWFNAGTYLGKKHVLALGVGADSQNGLMLSGREQDYFAWTADVFYDQPISGGDGLTFSAAYTNIDHAVNGIAFTRLASGDCGYLLSLKAGYLFGHPLGLGQLQPFAHYQRIGVDEDNKKDTQVYGAGLNYYIKGPANKLSLEVTRVDQDEEIAKTNVQNETIITVQFAAGF
ncbi:porin [Desulfatirhabdium butyrativorans]|uniref:porin n=1 Tax=Desulfatirhabdium butyrativorans TaxID=340467 RepID=UPI0003FB5DCE|nr:porin [Desulfatirhabdium butyrativorans]